MTSAGVGERLYKVLKDGAAYHGGTGKWNLPRGGQPGEWMPVIEGTLIPCRNGYHLYRESDLVRWLGPAIYEAECRGERLDDADKIVVREARLLRRVDAWNERIARLFACDCAEHVLHLFEKVWPDDWGPRQAIEIARRHANGEATDEELRAAEVAADAALAVVRAAAEDAWDAAGAAALAAAEDAALAVVRAAAEDAWDAAGAAALAARAARAGALAARAAWDAAALAAALPAENRWQTSRLLQYLTAGGDGDHG